MPEISNEDTNNMSNIFEGKKWCQITIREGGILHTIICEPLSIGIHASVTDYEDGGFIPCAMYRGVDSEIEFVISLEDRRFYNTLSNAKVRAEEMALDLFNKYKTK